MKSLMLQRMPMFLTSMKIRMFLFTLIQSIIPILKQLEFCYPLRMTRFVQTSNSGVRKFNNLSQLAHVDDIKTDCGYWIHNGDSCSLEAKYCSHVTKLASVKTINSSDKNC